MFSVYRKELRLYFRVQSTFVLLAILLAAVGICTAVFAPMGGLQFIPVYLAPVLLFTLPLSQIFADRRQRHAHFEDCYFAMGISPLSLTVGRFLAALTVFLIPVLELALLPLLLLAFGELSLGSIYTSILGLALLTALTSPWCKPFLPPFKTRVPVRHVRICRLSHSIFTNFSLPSCPWRKLPLPF